MEVNMFENLTDDELLMLLDDGKTSQDDIVTELLNREIEEDILLYLMEYWPKFRNKIWVKNLSNAALRYIIVEIPALRFQAVIRLCGRKLDEKDLETIIEHSPNNRVEAMERLADLLLLKAKNVAA